MARMLRQLTPPVARVAALQSRNHALRPSVVAAIEEAVPSLAVTVRAAPVKDDTEIGATMVGLNLKPSIETQA